LISAVYAAAKISLAYAYARTHDMADQRDASP